MHIYTTEQIEWIRNNSEGITRKDIATNFNKRFDADVNYRSIGGVMSRNKIRNKMQGHATRFDEGHEVWNKGMKGLNLGGEAGWFKKGYVSDERKPIGSTRVNQGDMIIKVAQPSTWKRMNRVVWEKHHGKINDDDQVLFKDGNKLNCDIDNLFLAPAGVAAAVGRSKTYQDDPELNVTAHRLAQLNINIGRAMQKE